MKYVLVSFYSLIILAIVDPASAQVGNWKHYGIKEGLPANTIYSVTQDKKGFIWIGTEAGLVRFDGSEFKTYTMKDGLPDNEIISVTADSLDRIWITPFKKNICFIKEGIIHTEKTDTLLANIAKQVSSTCTYFVGKNNRVWIYSRIILSVTNNQIKKIYLPNDQNHVRYIEDLNDHEFMVYTTTRFLKYKNYKLVDSFEVKNISNNYKNNINVLQDKIYYSTKDTIDIFERDQNYKFRLNKTYLLKGNSFSHCLALNNKLFIPSIGLGTYVCDNIKSATPSFYFIPNHSNSLFKDRDNNIWIATANEGLLFQQNNESVLTINNSIGLLFDNAGAVYADSLNNIYIGDGIGTLRCYTKGKIKTIIPPLRNINQYTKSIKIAAAKDYIAFSSDNYALILYNLKDKKTTLCSNLSTKSFIYSPFQNKFISGLSSGISYTNPTLPFATKYIYNTLRVTQICEDLHGTLYCGTPEGLYKWTDSFVPLFKTQNILSNRINTITCDANNIVWVSVSSGQIIAIHNDKIIYEFNPADNAIFTGTICRSMFADKRSNIWIATNNGLNKINYFFNANTNTIEVKNIVPYTTIDGLADNNINDVYVKDSMVYTATSKGVSVFNYIKIATTPPPPVFFTNININQRDTSIKDQYTLMHNQNNISIKYAGISFISDGKIRFRYKLIGSDDKWNYTSLNQIELKSLHDGDYTFVVEALDKFGNPSIYPAKITLHIKPAFYNTILFRVFSILLFAFIVYYLLLRLFNIRKKKSLEKIAIHEKIAQLEQQALRSQMNPHFIFNSLSAIQHYINQEDATNANKYLTMFSRLIRKTLNNSSETTISIFKEMDFLENYILLEQMRFKDTFIFTITCDENINGSNTFIPPMILQPFVENAIRHGLMYRKEKNGELHISFKEKDGQLVCYIDDNGIGFEASKQFKTSAHIEYQSKGITITNDRINTINAINNQKILIEIIDKFLMTPAAEGTIITITFPFLNTGY